MKKLIIIGSTLFAFSAFSFFASNNSDVYTKNGIASLDTVPKKDTAKKRDSITGYASNSYVLNSMDTVPKKDTAKKRDSVTLQSYASNSFLASMDTVPKKDTTKKRDSIALQSYASNYYLASLDTVPKKDTTKKKDSLFLAMR